MSHYKYIYSAKKLQYIIHSAGFVLADKHNEIDDLYNLTVY